MLATPESTISFFRIMIQLCVDNSLKNLLANSDDGENVVVSSTNNEQQLGTLLD